MLGLKKNCVKEVLLIVLILLLEVEVLQLYILRILGRVITRKRFLPCLEWYTLLLMDNGSSPNRVGNYW